MTNNKEDEKKSLLQAKFQEDTNPHRSWLNHFCLALGYVTALVALMIGVLEVSGIFFLKMTLFEHILNVYMMLFCVLIILTETNLFNVAKDSKILNVWAFRGLFYIFVGIMGVNAINSAVYIQGAEMDFKRGLFKNLMVIFSTALIGIGLLYVVLGLLWVQIINDKMEANFQERKKRAVEIKSAASKYGALAEGGGAATDGDQNIV